MAGDRSEPGRPQGRARLDMTGEFFSVGAPLHAVRAGYVKRRADDLLFNTVASGRYAHVLAPDRSGKSSLIAATAARLENNGCKVAVLDLEQIGVRDGGTDSGRWYYSVAYRLLRQLRIRYDLQTWWQDKSFLSNRQRLVEFYSEVVLPSVSETIVIFVDEIQCIEDLPYAMQLLASIRAAHNARATDPEFSRLSFALFGECDPVSLIEEADVSPFNITQQIVLDDFSRTDLDIFATELNLSAPDASRALDRIFHWTNGQPYLSQKLARAIARDTPSDDINSCIDHIATHQLAGRAALHSEPHMSHIHRGVVNDEKRSEPLLNLYGKLRKGIVVPADLGSPLQRRLIAIGLVVIDAEGNLKVRNKLYEAVFTARWANESQPTRYRVPAMVVAALLVFALIPFWYTQWLPGPYVRVLASDTVDASVAREAYQNLKSFPGHADTATHLYRTFLERRAVGIDDVEGIQQFTNFAAELPDPGRLAEEIEAAFWDRKTGEAQRVEDRDAALLASIQSLVLATSVRRQRAAALVGDDYPFLLATLSGQSSGTTVFDPVGMVLTTAVGAAVSQWSYTPQGMRQRAPWSVTALEVSPLVRRVIVDRDGSVNRIGLTINISHARVADLRIKLIAPSGRAIEVELDADSASSKDDIVIPARQLREFAGESVTGTWSISVRDESLGIAGQLVGWTLELNSQGAVEYLERGLDIPDPVERETDNVWFDSTGRYAVARAMQSDSARIWDLLFAEPVRAIAVTENEALIGLDSNARHLVTSTQDSVNLWDTATGDKIATLAVGAASAEASLTADGSHLFVVRRGDVETRLELWSLASHKIVAEIDVAGAPAHVAINANGDRVATADFDRAVRVWDFDSEELLGQFDLVAQPSEIQLSADGNALGAVYANFGISLWNIEHPERPILTEFGTGDWRFAFSPSGNLVATGRPETGFQIRSSADGRMVGPALGVARGGQSRDLLSFSHDEQIVLTGRSEIAPRFWRTTPSFARPEDEQQTGHTIWKLSADRIVQASPDGSFIVIGEPTGHIHIVPSDIGLADLTLLGNDISFVGHAGEVRLLSVDASGSLVASAAEDNSVRVWNPDDGAPLPYVVNVAGAPVSKLMFSPDASSLAILAGNRLSIVHSDDGELAAEFDLGGTYRAMTYADNDAIYIGGENGALQLVSAIGGNNWQTRQVWHGVEPIRLLQTSPRGNYLVLVDRNNLASQFVLSESRVAEQTLQLPSEVQEVVFSGARTYFRTLRWVHRASSSVSGLLWIDALFVPRALPGAGIVFGDGTLQSSRPNRLYLPSARNGYVGLAELNFSTSATTGLFGSRDELLQKWQARVSASRREGS